MSILYLLHILLKKIKYVLPYFITYFLEVLEYLLNHVRFYTKSIIR